MTNLNKSEQTLVDMMRAYDPGFITPSVLVVDILKSLEKKRVVYSVPDATGQQRWYLQDDHLNA